MADAARQQRCEGVAQALLQARRTHAAADAAHLANALDSADDAYAVQDLVARAMHGPVDTIARFWKSGGPGRQATSTHAALPSEGVWSSPAHARGWPFNFRLIEVEIALRLREDVTPAQARVLTHEDAPALVDAMAVSIEVVDSRWRQGIGAPPLLKLADLQSHGALVLGAWVPYAPRDWASQECRVTIGTGAPTSWQGTHAMGDPAWVLAAWLKHVTRQGQNVPANAVVTTGTWCGMLPASEGDLVVGQFPGIGEASVQL